MGKLIYKNKTDGYLEKELIEARNYLVELYDILNYLPVKSILGRMGTLASIRATEQKIDAIEAEQKRRV